MKVIVVMPGQNVAATLRMTYAALPLHHIDSVILVDDGSSDQTREIARELGLELFIHQRNMGYGAAQKTCYREALKAGADIVVMVHPDYQYDPTLVPWMIEPIARGEAQTVLGSRLLGANPVAQGMPQWKWLGNRLLTSLENQVFGLHLSEYHTGYRAFSRRTLELTNFEQNSDDYIFDQEHLAQIAELGLRIEEIAIPTRYFPEAGSMRLGQCIKYGVSCLGLLARFWAHKHGWRQRQFDSVAARYVRG